LKYLDYREEKKQGTFDFPLAFYHVDENHPRYQMPYHWHPEYELFRILSGSFQLTVDGQLLTAVKGDILFIQGGRLHGGIPENCIYECIVFDMKLLLGNNKICSKEIQQLIRLEASVLLKLPEKSSSLQKIIQDLYAAVLDRKQGYEFIVQGSLYLLLGYIFENNLLSMNTAGPTTASLQINRFKDVLNYIEEHYTETISLETMASIAGFSPRYFCRFFRKMTQSTPTEYLNYFRIECACEQLVETSGSVTDVALSCGFNDISYFIKSFHKAKGMTPKQYRDVQRRRA
jgi:AraC-type DNA-binding domain-containing proteins